jgi:hypothetical protein
MRALDFVSSCYVFWRSRSKSALLLVPTDAPGFGTLFGTLSSNLTLENRLACRSSFYIWRETVSAIANSLTQLWLVLGMGLIMDVLVVHWDHFSRKEH